MNALATLTPGMMSDISIDMPISEFRLVHVHFKDREQHNTHLMHATQVDRFIQATVELHHSPGINPANNNKTLPISEISAYNIRSAGPYWWTTPGLAIDPAAGATTMDTDHRTHRWTPAGGPNGTIWKAPEPQWMRHLNAVNSDT